MGGNMKTQESRFSVVYWVLCQRQLTVPLFEKQQEESCSEILLLEVFFTLHPTLLSLKMYCHTFPPTLSTKPVYVIPYITEVCVSAILDYSPAVFVVISSFKYWWRPGDKIQQSTISFSKITSKGLRGLLCGSAWDSPVEFLLEATPLYLIATMQLNMSSCFSELQQSTFKVPHAYALLYNL